MRRSSAAQMEFEGLEVTTSGRPSDTKLVLEGLAHLNVGSDPASAARLGSLVSIAPQREMDAATSRLAGRINAAAISDHEHKALLRERAALLDLKFSGNISPQELNRLEYVRWSLDRVEDAKNGESLDLLEDLLTKYERILLELRDLEYQLNKVVSER